MILKRTCILTALFLFGLIPKVFSAMMFDPALQWKSIKTEHFWIHYHQGLEDHARQCARYAEDRYQWLTRVHHWEPRLRTDLVLVDNMDLANGFAMPFPFNRVQLFIVRPSMDSLISHYTRWDDMVFTHEYTHILNLDTINGLPSCTRSTIGRFCFPGMFMPFWAIEGNPVNYESLIDGRGRNHSTMTDMVMRMEYAGNRLKPISLASHYPREWPSGDVPYLYGGLFVEFLEKKYGKYSFARIFEDNSDNIVPYLVNRSARNQYGKSFNRLWKEWHAFLEKRYSGQLRTIKADGITRVQKITSSGYRTTLPRFSADGKWIAFVRMDATQRSSLMKYSLTSQRLEEIDDVHMPSSISVSSRGRIYATDVEFHHSFSLYSDVYTYSGRRNKLTAGGRIHYLDVSRNDERIVYVQYSAGKYSLILSDTRFKRRKVIIDRTDMQIGFPRFSPDGNRIVFSLKNRNGFTDLVLYDNDLQVLLQLTSDNHNDITPSWHPDGARILFSSDRSGVYNLYEILPEDRAIRRITNVAGGAFHPDVSPDGTAVVMVLYDPTGYNIALADYPAEPVPAGAGTLTFLNIRDFYTRKNTSETGKDYAPRNYSPLHSIAPPLWIPVFGSHEMYEGRYDFAAGFVLPGADTLFRHFYLVSADYFTVQKRLHLNTFYQYSGLYPDLMIEYENESLFLERDSFPWTHTLDTGVKRTLKHSGGIAARFPLLYLLSSHSFTAGYFAEETTTDIAYPSPGVETRYRDMLARIHLQYEFTNAREYTYSVSKEDGREIRVFTDIYKREFGSDISFFKGWFEYSELFRGISLNHVAAVILRGGVSENNPEYLSPFPLGRFEKGEWRSPPDDEDGLGMRGYPSGALYGNRLAMGIVEYRFPVVRKDLGYKTIPLMFRNISTIFFAEYGNIWNGSTAFDDFRWSAGMEVHLKITAGYYIDLTGYAGYAKGFSRNGEDQFYFGVVTLVEGAAKSGKRPHARNI